MLQQTPTTSRNKKAHSVLEIDTALEEWKTSEARNSFWYYRQLMNSSLLLTHQ